MNSAACLLLLVFPFLLLYATLVFPLKHIGKRRDFERFGYLEMPYAPPRRAFGRQQYTVRRDASEGRLRGLIVSNNPCFYRRESRLKERTSAQEAMDCEVCGRQTEDTWCHDNGPVFLEQWSSWQVCFVPVSRRLVETEAFCRRHVPRDWSE
jgi:hypothetical protein